MNETISQQQSIGGRIHATHIAGNVFKQNHLFGYGTGSYTLAIDKQLNQDSTAAYTSYAPNIIVQWGVEKGLIGLLLYVFLLYTICHTLWQKKENTTSLIAGYTLVALFIKELSLSTVCCTPLCSLLCCVLLSLLQTNISNERNQTNQFTNNQYIIIVLAPIYLIMMSFIIFYKHDEKSDEAYRLSFKDKNYLQAILQIEQTRETTPRLINKVIICMDYYKHSHDTTYIHKAKAALNKLQSEMPEDVYIDYLSAKYSYIKGDKEQTYKELKQLIATYPNNALFHNEMYKYLYDTGQKGEALMQLTVAIRLYPSILNMNTTKELAVSDKDFYLSLTEQLLKDKPNKNAQPTTLARYGYIAYYCKDIPTAEHYLVQALTLVPNLSSPWYLLGQIYREQQKENKAVECLKKYQLLTTGTFHLSNTPILDIEKEPPMESELWKEYTFKFRDWYKCDLIIPDN